MATIQTVNNGDSGFAARIKINNNDANINVALEAAEALLSTDNPNFNDFQKITDVIKSIQSTLSANDANYNTLQKIVDKLKIAETKLATIATGAEVNVPSDWSESNNTHDAFIKNKPTFGTALSKDVGNAVGNIQENGAILGNSQTVETDATGKFITATKNTAYNANFGTGNTNVAKGDASYLKANTYTQTETNNALSTKEATANKAVAGGYASLDSNAQVPLSQIPASAKSSKVVADIATRNFIASADRFEGLRVHVLDATADTTVTSGSAGYILKSGLSNTDWEKTYESETLDIDLSIYFNKTTNTLDDVTAGTTNKHFTAILETKLSSIEENATADQTDAEIKTAYERNVDTNPFTDAEKTKLTGIQQNATADQSDLEIKTAYESNVNTNAFTDAEKTKLVNLSKADVGLGNAANTSDADKPISTAQQNALDGKLAKVSNLSDVGNRQTALNVLTDVSNATNEYILTKDAATGNAIYKPAPGGSGGTNLSIGTNTGTTVNINSDTGSNATVPAATPSNAGLLTSADKMKLDSVEAHATADQTDAEIKTGYENNANTNAFTNAEKANLSNQTGTNTGDEVAATEVIPGIAEIATQAEAEAGVDNTNKFLNPLKAKQAFEAFLLQQFGTIAGKVTEGNDDRLLVKRLKILVGSSTAGNKKGVSFAFGATISNPFFLATMTSSNNNNDAFCVKVINITTTTAYLEVYRADGNNWNDTNVACFVTIYAGAY